MAENTIIRIPNLETLKDFVAALRDIGQDIHEQAKIFENECNSQAYIVNEFMQDVQSKLNEIRETILSLQEELNQLKEEIHKNEEVMRQYEQRAKQLKESIDKNQQEIKSLQDQLNDTKDSEAAQSIRRRIAQLEEETAVLRKEHADVIRRYNASAQECAERKQQYMVIADKQNKYKLKYQQIYLAADSFNTEWAQTCEQIDSANIPEIGLQYSQIIAEISNKMAQFQKDVEAIYWGYSRG